MIAKHIAQNKKTYIAYNHFRKAVFSELAPRDSEMVLYLLPWLLCVNHPSVPGFIQDLERPFKVYGIDSEKEIVQREPAFKKMFEIESERSLLGYSPDICWIQGVYTIGSTGTIGQTSASDCDIWICVDRRTGCNAACMNGLYRKINLIKDWMDANLKLPVYFFITDAEDIQNCRFGLMDAESSGTVQKNVLKEEFYRTGIRICGKIPVWWVCFRNGEPAEYTRTVAELMKPGFEDYDFIDLGNLESVGAEESFGAAVWQINKALTHPLKSIIKMLMLKMMWDEAGEALLCSRFRASVLRGSENEMFLDPHVFSMRALLAHYRKTDGSMLAFIKKCMYVRCDIRMASGRFTIRERLAEALFSGDKLSIRDIHRLNEFPSWSYAEQSRFGGQIFDLLVRIYKDIARVGSDACSGIDPKDMTIIGRKLSACLKQKPHKIPVLHKPTSKTNPPKLVFDYGDGRWRVCEAEGGTVVSSSDIVRCLAYLVWNRIYDPDQTRMNPNPTSITMQETINLAGSIREAFGGYDISAVPFENFLGPEKATRLLMVTDFESPVPQDDHPPDACLIYKNTWGELFVRRFPSMDAVRVFMNETGIDINQVDMNYYVRRSSLVFEKTIERSKNGVSRCFRKKR